MKDEIILYQPNEPALEKTWNVDIADEDYGELQYQCTMYPLMTMALETGEDILLQSMMDNCERHGAEQDIYYTHSDHLGSANWITDKNGVPIQYLHYLPYGQLLANQQATGSTYDERYKFTGKERDEESGYDYFGARYYIPPLLHWSSVDPLVDNYLWISPYAYCGWNPVKFVDPDGNRIIVVPSLTNPDFYSKALGQLEELKQMNPELNKMITGLEMSLIDFFVTYDNKINHYSRKEKTIGYDPYNDRRIDGKVRPTEAVLAHELGHAENDKNGTAVNYDSKMANGKIGTPKEQAIEQEKRDKNEANPIYYENIVREEKGFPQRGYNYSAGD